jgi:hypothetical protein
MLAELSQPLGKPEFIRKPQTHFGMLQHMIKVQRRQRIILRMNKRTVITKV